MKRLTVLMMFIGAPALADAEGYYGHMMNDGYGVGMMFGPVLWLIVLGLIVAGVIWMVRRLDGPSGPGGQSAARHELDLRFARGEIDAEDYAARKKMLQA